MFGFLSGSVQIIRAEQIILNNNGVGFLINIAKNIIKNYEIGAIASFLIETKIKNSQESISLFGFENEFQRIFFSHLCLISGVGDKLAQNISCIFSAKDLLDYCLQNKTKLDIKIDGMGPKTWEKILFYLMRNKNLHKICMEFISSGASMNQEDGSSTEGDDIDKDDNKILEQNFSNAKLALMSLGISASISQNLLKEIQENSLKGKKIHTTEEIIKEALMNYRSY